ncbi:STY0301 family protein [Duganella aquatilis]|uniref:STY0301 family protein n=1 Tax=Duganella aquatilis TaxID=2666082 RepID=UPI0035311580
MVATVLLLVGATALTAQVPQCPADLSAGSIKVQPSPGWTGVPSTRLLLSGAGVVIGRPDVEPRAELRGGARQLSKRVTETTYSGLSEQEKWLICTYGRGGELEQARPLPPEADQCVVRVTRSQYNDVTVAVACTNLAPSK